MSYSARDLNDKEVEMSQFLAEILANSKTSGGDLEIEPKILSDESIMRYHQSLMSHYQAKNRSIIEDEYIADLLKFILQSGREFKKR